MDYQRRSARILRIDMIRNETIVTKMRLKEGILQEIEERQLRWYGHVIRIENCRMDPQGTRDATDQSTHEGMGLGTAGKAETLGMKNVSIERSGGKRFMSLCSGNPCIHKNNSFNNKIKNLIIFFYCYGTVVTFKRTSQVLL
jgi:hypothetical protein